MPGSSNSSFIPKRNPEKESRRGGSARPVFIGTILIRVFFFAVLIATIITFAWQKIQQRNLDAEIERMTSMTTALKNEQSQKSINEILNTDTRLFQTKVRLERAMAVSAVFSALRATNVDTVQIKNLSLKREDATNQLALEIDMDTDTFDSVLFQRKILEESNIINISGVQDVKLERVSDVADSRGNVVRSTSGKISLNFKAKLTIAGSNIPQIPANKRGLVEEVVPVTTEEIEELPVEEAVEVTNENI